MADYNVGKGVYIWQPGTIEDGNPDRIAARLKLAGAQSAAVKLCDGLRVFPGLEPLIQTLRNNQIRVIGWGYSYLNEVPIQEAHMVAQACHKYKPDLYLIDVEDEVEGNYEGARLFMKELRPATAGLPLGLNSFWNVRNHPSFPWADFMQYVDFACPQVYWRGVDPVGKLELSQQSYESIPNSPDRPMPIVAGDLHVFQGVKPTPDQVTAFLTAANADPFIHGVLMWAADDTQTTPELWQAFSAFEWKGTGGGVPTQPLGWAKIKAGGGLWIRAAPSGNKVGSLSKAELTPLWRLTETKWAAITQKGDRWIYVGNPALTDVTWDSSAGGQPPAAPGAYQARVAARQGLNVRTRAQGGLIRAIPFGTVVQVYEEQNGWGRIHPVLNEWVNTAYLTKIA